MLPSRGTVPITVYVLVYGLKNWQACRIIDELDYGLPVAQCRVDNEDIRINFLRDVSNYSMVC
jgi:hypothetical protein